MPRPLALVLIAALALAIPTGAGWASGDTGNTAGAAAKKKCKKGYKRKKVKVKKGKNKGKKVSKCVKSKQKLSGPVPADGSYSGKLGTERYITVFVTKNRKKVTVEMRVPQAKLTCTPSGKPARGGQVAKLVDLPIKPDGSFSGSDQFNAGRGPGSITGRFVNATTVSATASVSGRTNGDFNDTCAGSDSYSVKLKPGLGF